MSKTTEEQLAELRRTSTRLRLVENDALAADALDALLDERTELLKAFDILEYEAKQPGGLLLHAEHNTGRRGLG